MNDSSRQRRRMIWLWPLIAVASLALLAFISAALQVEDWRRDWTQNTATTADDAADERLRPVTTSRPPEEVARIVEDVAASLSGWQFINSQTSPDGALVLHLTRTTRVWRFVDDVRVRIVPGGGGCTVHAQSQSRVGRGDLGQNPRNLRELLAAVRARLAAE